MPLSESFSLSVQVADEGIELKPFVSKALAKVILGLVEDLKKVDQISDVSLVFDHSQEPKKQVLLEVNGDKIPIKDYVRDMIQKTVCGFLLSLNGMPTSFEEMLKLVISINLN